MFFELFFRLYQVNLINDKVDIKYVEGGLIMKSLMYPCLWFDGNALEAAEFYCLERK